MGERWEKRRNYCPSKDSPDAVAKELCGDGADFELEDSVGNTPMKHHRRNGENGDAVLVGGFLEECERPDPTSPAAAESLRS